MRNCWKNRCTGQRVLKGIGFGCKQYGWQYVIVPLETENPLVIPAYLDAESCVGGIAAGTVQSEFLVAVKQQNMPLVLVDHEERMLDADSVVNGNQEAAVSAAQRLIANGRKRLLFVGHDAFSVSFRERWLGFRFAADQREAPCTFEKWEIPYGHEGWKEALQAKVGESAPRFPDGCLCANDEIALELIKQLTAQNIRVPEECHVIGIDNIEMSQYAAPPLTTVDLAKESLGSRAVKALYDRVQDPKRRSEKIVLATQLIVRGSG